MIDCRLTVSVQLLQARQKTASKLNDLAREAVGWNGGLGGDPLLQLGR
jgi:hypothetical protein